MGACVCPCSFLQNYDNNGVNEKVTQNAFKYVHTMLYSALIVTVSDKNCGKMFYYHLRNYSHHGNVTCRGDELIVYEL